MAPGIGEKGGDIMKKTIYDSDMPIGKLTKVKDFLPPPGELVIPEETKKITISLKKSSIDFFRAQAKKYHTKYQRMIRELIDAYVTRFSRA